MSYRANLTGFLIACTMLLTCEGSRLRGADPAVSTQLATTKEYVRSLADELSRLPNSRGDELATAEAYALQMDSMFAPAGTVYPSVNSPLYGTPAVSTYVDDSANMQESRPNVQEDMHTNLKETGPANAAPPMQDYSEGGDSLGALDTDMVASASGDEPVMDGAPGGDESAPLDMLQAPEAMAPSIIDLGEVKSINGTDKTEGSINKNLKMQQEGIDKLDDTPASDAAATAPQVSTPSGGPGAVPVTAPTFVNMWQNMDVIGRQSAYKELELMKDVRDILENAKEYRMGELLRGPPGRMWAPQATPISRGPDMGVEVENATVPSELIPLNVTSVPVENVNKTASSPKAAPSALLLPGTPPASASSSSNTTKKSENSAKNTKSLSPKTPSSESNKNASVALMNEEDVAAVGERRNEGGDENTPDEKIPSFPPLVESNPGANVTGYTPNPMVPVVLSKITEIGQSLNGLVKKIYKQYKPLRDFELDARGGPWEQPDPEGLPSTYGDDDENEGAVKDTEGQ